MTNKEAIERLTYIKTHDTDPEDYALFDLAIKALEDKPQEYNYNHDFGADRVCIDHLNDKDREHLLNKIRPTGKWIRKVDEVGFISHICSECGAEIEVEDCSDDKFCFNCGAKMKKGDNE